MRSIEPAAAHSGAPGPGRQGALSQQAPVTYLDHAATSPLRPEVAQAMAPFGSEVFGNPAGSHRVSRRAAAALEEAREEVAEIVGCRPGEVIFTASGTEADNLAVLGALRARRPAGASDPAVVVCSAVEHPAVLATCRAATTGLAGSVQLEVAPVDRHGSIDLGHLEDLLDERVALVSVMLANNEVGTIQPLCEVATLARQRAPGAIVHTDAVQAASFLDLRTEAAGASLVSLSAHKLGGPKGVGILVARHGVPLAPVVFGGGQERGRRSGTQNVAGAVGAAVALRVAARSQEAEARRLAKLRDRLADELAARLPGVVELTPRSLRLPGHLPLGLRGVDHEELLVLLDEQGVCASAGSACASGALGPSDVLLAMGRSPAEAREALRLTLGWTTTEADVTVAVDALAMAAERLRAGASAVGD